MTHFVQLVDRQDNLLGYKWRDDLNDSDIWRISTIDVREMGGDHILIQKRSTKKQLDPGRWTIAAAGTLEKDDTYESCAVRELMEEVGITGCILREEKKIFIRSQSLGFRQSMIYSVQIPLDTLLVPQESEVDDVQWIKECDLKDWIARSPQDFTDGTLQIWRVLGFI